MVAIIDDDWPAFEYITGPGPGAGVGKDADPGFIESLSRYMRAAANPSAVHAYEKMNGQIDTRPILPSIQAPTLVMNRTGVRARTLKLPATWPRGLQARNSRNTRGTATR
ncbi:MAG: hypothetical protein DME40_09120 [Verrucomicrobia bacterium]|nr:MAG: hypothetical protein DME37_05380 [Verrucomicrobiota bacterium]PYK90038.1 MAG: hypothetical protein DME40_09120 [Verrucomicrobiota bacterium]